MHFHTVLCSYKDAVVLQPLETMTGLLTQPGFTGKQPVHVEALAKVRMQCRVLAGHTRQGTQRAAVLKMFATLGQATCWLPRQLSSPLTV
jgi:hypothetical protein